MNVILVPVDGSDSSERAVRRAAEIARSDQGHVVVLNVLPITFVRDHVAQMDPASVDVEESFAQEAVDRAVALLAEMGVRAEGKILRGVPAQVILDQARELGAGLVVVGAGRGEHILPEGSVSNRLRKAKIPLEVVT